MMFPFTCSIQCLQLHEEDKSLYKSREVLIMCKHQHPPHQKLPKIRGISITSVYVASIHSTTIISHDHDPIELIRLYLIFGFPLRLM